MRPLLPLLPLVGGCFAFDGLVIPARPLEAYDLSSEVIPAEQLELVRFPSTDGTELVGLWANQDDPDAPVLLHIHGNGGALTQAEWGRLETHWSWGFRVFAFDYRGYGLAAGEPTREGILEEDGRAAAEYLADQTGLSASEIPWIALSLGGAIAIHTNDEIDAAAIVLESTFASTDQLIEEGTGFVLPSGWFFEQTFDNEAAIADVRAPILVVHGREDDFVAPTHGRTLFEAAPDNPKWLWQPAGVAHSDIHEVMPEVYRDVVLSFLADPASDPTAALSRE